MKDAPSFPEEPFPLKNYDWANKVFLGEGSFGKVFRVKSLKTGQDVAIKQMAMKNFRNEEQLQALKSEITAMKELKSPFTVTLIEESMGKNFTYIVLDLCETDLGKQTQKFGGKLPEAAARKAFFEIIEGFKVLHNAKYVHRDVKPANVLVKDGVHKIADYGFCKKLDKIECQRLDEVCGSPLYMAPQLLFSQEYTSKCDIWSLGLMLYEVLLGYTPWPCRQMDSYKNSLLSKCLAFPYHGHISDEAKDLIRRCIVIDETKRISWQELFNHPFIKGKNGLMKVTANQEITPIAVSALRRSQESVRRKNVDVLKLMQSSNIIKFTTVKALYDFLAQLDPTLTLHEASVIFQALDRDKDGKASFQEFKTVFCEIDFKEEDERAVRLIEDLISLLQSRNLSPQSFFVLADQNKSGTLEKNELTDVLRKIGPGIRDFEINLIWEYFKPQNGIISSNDFYKEIMRGTNFLPAQQVNKAERAHRNLQGLKEFFLHNKFTADAVIAKGDSTKKGQISGSDFGVIVKSINYAISEEEIVEMFTSLDKTNDKLLSVNELRLYLS